ncbi:hypothetical protein FOZ61_010769 [Perkinsus olseni]|uniref:A to I editase domain-containing protein n=1 Tax=Perkinsus olseni TaxID=32597 RepID=A0A7J6M389_PEROL|nr:hypothetical protein FOZ61_010769 [Perkinsus olseni]
MIPTLLLFPPFYTSVLSIELESLQCNRGISYTVPWRVGQFTFMSSPTPSSSEKASVRSAEKSRISTCPFADRIATAVVGTYRSLTGTSAESPMAPNVLAGFVIFDEESDKMEVLSLAVGTKYLPPNIVREDEEGRNELVHDCHAEVLARLSLLRWLQDCEEWPESKTLHLYTSSAPCGNACIKRWISGKKEKFDAEERLWLVAEHKKVELHSVPEGQVEATFKAAQGDPPMREYFPKGIVRASAIEDTRGRILSCSDKIALWNVLGIEGGGGRRSRPIFIESITVGRKFSRGCCERALCCRMEFKGGPKEVKHPSLMCSAVKFQEGGMDAEKGADFTDGECRWWRRCDDGTWEGEVLDGSTGRCADGAVSKLARCQRREGGHGEKRSRIEEVYPTQLSARHSPFERLFAQQSSADCLGWLW